MISRKTWCCHFNKKNKTEGSKRCTDCTATVDIKIKKLNRDTIKNDKFLAHDPPLQAVITVKSKHNHNNYSFDAMKFLRATKAVREEYIGYFEMGHGVAASIALHEAKLELSEDGDVLLGASCHNPLPTTVAHWYRLWKEKNYGMDIDPLSKLEEKQEDFRALGKKERIIDSLNI